jgi:two-component system chemotaxis response regulator CheB
MTTHAPIKVLLVDDSPLVTRVVSDIINEDKELKVMGTAADPYEAVEIMRQNRPDVILLDIEMPRMDGLTFLRKIMTQHPIPVVIFSGVAEKNSLNAIKALEYGAVAVLQKPKSISSPGFREIKILFLETLKGAAASHQGLPLLRKTPFRTPQPLPEEAVRKKIAQTHQQLPSRQIIVIGSSTGGTQAIEFLLRNLPPEMPGILITQHMPGEFTRSFAERLNMVSPLCVKEAENGEVVRNNCVYISNGFYHLLVENQGLQYTISLKDGPLVNRHKPSVDVLFRSAARHVASRATGILLTGMGNDGAKGLLEMKEAGALTIAQDKASSVVWGMPGTAVQLGAAQKVLSLKMILDFLKGYAFTTKRNTSK